MRKKRTSIRPSHLERLQIIGHHLLDGLEKRISSCHDLEVAPANLNDTAVDHLFGRKLSVVEIYIQLAELIMKLEKAVTFDSSEPGQNAVEIPITSQDRLLVEEFLRRQTQFNIRKISADCGNTSSADIVHTR
jgi:hypothetical protein